MTTIFIVRHGNTFAADEPPLRIGCRTDLPLTAEGREQASALGRRFAQEGVGFVRALCGPLQRTVATARHILDQQPTPIPLASDRMLAEIDHGPDEGRPEAAVQARLGPEILRRWDDEGLVPDGWIVDRAARIAWWRRVFEQSPEGSSLIVTSNGTARFALLALEDQARPRSLKLRTGAYGRLTRAAPGEPFRCVDWDVRPSPGHGG